MKRRRAVKRIGLLAGAAILGAGGWKFFQLHQRPDLRTLEEHEELLGDLSETIIPATDSPGAKEAAVGSFIVKMIRDCADRKTANNFVAGLRDLMDRTHRQFGKSFRQCSAEERTSLLAHFERAGEPHKGLFGKVEHQIVGDSFYTTLKKYTVLGYCSSRPGATRGMRYDFIPGRYAASVPLAPGQRSWATQ